MSAGREPFFGLLICALQSWQRVHLSGHTSLSLDWSQVTQSGPSCSRTPSVLTYNHTAQQRTQPGTQPNVCKAMQRILNAPAEAPAHAAHMQKRSLVSAFIRWYTSTTCRPPCSQQQSPRGS